MERGLPTKSRHFSTIERCLNPTRAEFDRERYICQNLTASVIEQNLTDALIGKKREPPEQGGSLTFSEGCCPSRQGVWRLRPLCASFALCWCWYASTIERPTERKKTPSTGRKVKPRAIGSGRFAYHLRRRFGFAFFEALKITKNGSANNSKIIFHRPFYHICICRHSFRVSNIQRQQRREARRQ